MQGRGALVAGVLAGLLLPGGIAAADRDNIPDHGLPRFEKTADAVTKVEDALNTGDRYLSLCYETADDDDPNREWVHFYATQAKGWYRRAETLEPQNAYAQLATAYVSMIMGRVSSGDERRRAFAEARGNLMRALDRRAGYADAHRYLGELDARDEKWADAERHFRRLCDSKIEDSHIHAWLGYVLYQQGKTDLAKEHWKKARDYGRPAACADYARERLE